MAPSYAVSIAQYCSFFVEHELERAMASSRLRSVESDDALAVSYRSIQLLMKTVDVYAR